MEGVGSRLGRASSRYGTSASAAVFNGPVRKWKKKWVPVSASSTATNRNSHFHSNANSNTSRLLLWRWTPLSPANAADTPPDEPPRRRFRYTPIVVLEEEIKAAKEIDNETTTTTTAVGTNHQLPPLQTSTNDELNLETPSKTETQDSNTSSLDLGLCLKGHNSNNDSIGQRKEDQTKKASSGFWTT